MKLLFQKLPVDSEASFVARTYTTPWFETPWHQHIEYELMMIRKSSGTAFIGNFIGEYHENEVYFLGKNLPHWFRKSHEGAEGSSVVIQFREAFLGERFFHLPETQHMKRLLQLSASGLLLRGELAASIGSQITALEHKKGFEQLAGLLAMLHEISQDEHFILLDRSPENYYIHDEALINRVFEYSMQHFRQKIRLSDVASLTHQSISAFSHYFKKVTKKNYIQFLTEIRIAHASQLLKNTEQSVTEICYASGYQNWANFSKQFKQVHGKSPGQFRKEVRKQPV